MKYKRNVLNNINSGLLRKWVVKQYCDFILLEIVVYD